MVKLYKPIQKSKERTSPFQMPQQNYETLYSVITYGYCHKIVSLEFVTYLDKHFFITVHLVDIRVIEKL